MIVCLLQGKLREDGLRMAVSGIPTRQLGGRGEALIKSGQMLVDKAEDGECQKSRSKIDSATRSINAANSERIRQEEISQVVRRE